MREISHEYNLTEKERLLRKLMIKQYLRILLTQIGVKTEYIEKVFTTSAIDIVNRRRYLEKLMQEQKCSKE